MLPFKAQRKYIPDNLVSFLFIHQNPPIWKTSFSLKRLQGKQRKKQIRDLIAQSIQIKPGASLFHTLFIRKNRELSWTILAIMNVYKCIRFRDFLVIQWLTLHSPKAGGPGSSHAQETRSHLLQLRILMVQWRLNICMLQLNKWCSQINK